MPVILGYRSLSILADEPQTSPYYSEDALMYCRRGFRGPSPVVLGCSHALSLRFLK